MPFFEIATILHVVTRVEADSAEEAIKKAEHFVGSWCEPTYEDLDDYNSDHPPIDQVQDWDVVKSIDDAEEWDVNISPSKPT